MLDCLKSVELRKLKLHCGFGSRVHLSDDQLAPNLATDLPVLGWDGYYYSRTLKRAWYEVRGKTYEQKPREHQRKTLSQIQASSYEFEVYCAKHHLRTEDAIGIEAARKLETICDSLPPKHRKCIRDILRNHYEAEYDKGSARRSTSIRWHWYRSKDPTWSPKSRMKPLPLP